MNITEINHEVHPQYPEKNRILGGEWWEMLMYAGIISLWPQAFNLLSHAHCLFCPLLPSKHGGLILMLRYQVALGLYLQRDRTGAFWQITCNHGDCRAILRLIYVFKTKLEIQILCYSHCVSVPLHTPPPSFLSFSMSGSIFNAHNLWSLLPIFPDLRKPFFSLKLSMTSNNFVKYISVNRIEIFTISSLSDISRIQKLIEYSYFRDTIVMCISSVKICSYNKRQLETLVKLLRLWLECHVWKYA